jgi:hypothetical protein
VINYHNYVIRGIIRDVIRKLKLPCRRVISKGCGTPQRVPTHPFLVYIFRGPPPHQSINQFICFHYIPFTFLSTRYKTLSSLLGTKEKDGERRTARSCISESEGPSSPPMASHETERRPRENGGVIASTVNSIVASIAGRAPHRHHR